MNKTSYQKIICITLSIILCIPLLSGCYDRREVDDMAYVIGLGIDKGQSNKLKLTLQIVVPTAIGGAEGGGEGDKAVTYVTLEAPTVFSGIDMANGFVSKQLNLSHAKVIVFSKELAQEGIEDFVYAFARSTELRPNLYVAISRSTAEGYLKITKPALESNPAKYYDLLYKSYNYTGFTANTQFHYFYLQQKSLSQNAVATLAGVSTNKSSKDLKPGKEVSEPADGQYPQQGDYKAGDLPKISEIKSETMGLAAFNGSKMVGELDGEEASFYLMATGKYKLSTVAIPDPFNKDKHVIINVKKSRNPIRRVEVIDGKPHITVMAILEGDIASIQTGTNYEDPGNLYILENAYEEFIKEGLERFLNRTTTEFKSDICGFGRQMKWKFLTWNQWSDFNWAEKYQDATFDVSVDMKVRRAGLIIKSVPIKSIPQ